MLSIHVELLTGGYASSGQTDPIPVQCPPHPSYVFAALWAAWAEAGEPSDEGAVLHTLATLPAPVVYAPEDPDDHLSKAFCVPLFDTAELPKFTTSWIRFNRAWLKREETRAGLVANDLAASTRIELEKTLARANRLIAKLFRALEGLANEGNIGSLAIRSQHQTVQIHSFPRAIPNSASFALLWQEAALAPGGLEALDRLLARVNQIDHLRALVIVRRMGDPPAPNWKPLQGGQHARYGASPGDGTALASGHQGPHAFEPHVVATPTPGHIRAEEVNRKPPVHRSLLEGDFIVYERVGGPSVPVTQGLELAKQIHRALVQRAEQQDDGTVHPAVSGRDPDGKVTEETHVLIVPLPYVGSIYADGSISGVAFVIPSLVSESGRIQIVRALGRWENAHDPQERLIRLYRGPQGSLELRRIRGRSDRTNLQQNTWCHPSRHWITATAMVLDRNPKTLWARDPTAAAAGEARALDSIRRSCLRIGLPEPERIQLERGVPLNGTAPVVAHQPLQGAHGGPRRIRVHARLQFTTPVQGPVILGAGRFNGAGLFLPFPAQDG